MVNFDAKQLANSYIRELRPYQPGKAIEALQREQGITDVIKLASNENPLGPSPLAIAAAQASLNTSHLYPDPDGYSLKQALAARYAVTPAHLTLGNGSDNVLAMIAQAFLDPDHHTLISEYAFSTFSIITRAMRGQVQTVPAKHYAHDLEAMARAITDKTQIIFLANANNPTGTWFNHQALARFLAAVPSQVLVVIDEAYYGYVDDPDYPDSIALQTSYPNLIITRTFSKLYGLAGLRVGFGIANPQISDYLNRVRLPFNVSTPALAAACAALEDTMHIQRSLECNRQGMRQMEQGLQQLDIDYIPSATNFITIKLDIDASIIYERMQNHGIIVRPLVPYGLPQHLRISIGTEQENSRCLKCLGKQLKELKK